MPVAGECVAGLYRLEYPLAEGGMGSVWRAEHLELGAAVALKFQHACGPSRSTSRFRREARSASRLSNPHVVRIVDFGVDGQTPYLAMELLEGESLRERLDRQGTASLAETDKVVRQAASALDAAHEAGVIHRDLKPSNLFLAHTGQGEIVKLLDFGIAKWSDSHAPGETVPSETLTESGLLMGSAHYMSPEQTRGEGVDGRTDVWALGVVAYQMLTGLSPFRGRNVPETLQRICAGQFEAPSLVLGTAYASLDPVFAKVFELEREQRYETAGLFAAAFAETVSGLPGAMMHVRPDDTSVVGRDEATASVLPRRTSRVGRRKGVLSGFALALIIASAVYLTLHRPGARSSSPGEQRPGTATRHYLPAPPPHRAEAFPEKVAEPATVSGAAGTSVAPPPQSEDGYRLRSPRRVTKRASEVRSKPTTVEAPRVASTVDPVFGLELPATH